MAVTPQRNGILIMIIAHYAHRLPADYDIAIIRTRAKARGPVWDAIPGLYFKDFVLRECGRLGAIANEYSSLYLWQQDEAFRAAIETHFALDARKGQAAKPVSR